MFEQLPDIYVDSRKHEPAISVDVSNIDITVMKNTNREESEIQLSLMTKEVIDEQNKDTFCSTLLKLMNDKRNILKVIMGTCMKLGEKMINYFMQ